MARKVKTALICVAVWHWDNGLQEVKHCFKDAETAKLFYDMDFMEYLEGFKCYWPDIPGVHSVELKLINYITLNYEREKVDVCAIQGQ